MGAGFFMTPRCERDFKFQLDESFRQHFKLVFSRERSDRRVCLWEVSDGGRPRARNSQ